MTDPTNEPLQPEPVDPQTAALAEQYGQLTTRAKRAKGMDSFVAISIAMEDIQSDLEARGAFDSNGEFKTQYTEYYNKGLAEG